MFRLTLHGIAELLYNYSRYPGIVDAALIEGVTAEAHLALRNSLPRTPYETGALQSSGRVEVIGRDTDGVIRAQVVYGNDSDLFYAAITHEDLEAYRDVGEAKWLERTILQEHSGPAFAARLAPYVIRRSIQAYGRR